MARPASVGARGPVTTVIGVVFGAAALVGCTSIPRPGPIPTSVTATATSTTVTSSTSTSTSTSTSPSPTPVRIPTSTLPRYDVSPLIGQSTYPSPQGGPGPHGGVLLPQPVGGIPITVRGATGPVSMYIPCCSDPGKLMLVYQVDSTRVDHPTQIPIGDDQGIVLDGRLIAIHAIMQIGNQPRVQAQVIVFPASAAAGLPVVK